MAPKIDISDLMAIDGRLPYNWRSVKIQQGELRILFPHSGYSIDEDKSELRENGKEWALYVGINKDILLAMIQKQCIKIPYGVEKIVLGKIEYL